MTFVEEPISVRNAILLCIKHEIKGAESQLESFDNSKPNRLRGDQITALEGNLQCIYENVKVDGGGKRGKVYLSGLKEDIQQKEDGRSENEGQPPTKAMLLMSEYIHKGLYNMHVQGKHMEYGSNGWTKNLGILQKDDLPILKFEGRIREVHTNSSFPVFKPSQIAREFASAIYGMSTEIPKKCFEILRKSGHIEYVMNYNLKSVDDKKEVIEKELFDDIRSEIKLLLEELGSNVYEYNKAIENPTEKMKPIVQKVEEMLSREYRCKFVYKSYHVLDVVKCDSIIDKDDFMEAYWNDFTRRSERRQRGYDRDYGVNETWLWRKLWLFHTLILVEYMGHDVGGKLLLSEIEKPERIQQVSVAYQAWQESNKPEMAWGFTVEEDSGEDIAEVLEDMF